MQETTVKIRNRRLKLSNLDKVFYPRASFTKGDVIDYYRGVAEVLLPHLKGRPVTLKRYPNGVEGNHFYEKRCPEHRPGWIRTAPMRRKRDDKRIDLCRLDNEPALVWAANLADLELHVYLGRATDMNRPTAVVFDLDPGKGVGIIECAEVACLLRDLLDEMELDTFAKTSGAKGIQLYVPLNTKVGYAATKPFARTIARHLADRYPDDITANMAKEARKGKVFVDWSQNDLHKTTVCVYSLRARERPTASTPLDWDEIERACRKGDGERLFFEADEVRDRIEEEGDLFEPVTTLKQKLPPDLDL